MGSRELRGSHLNDVPLVQSIVQHVFIGRKNLCKTRTREIQMFKVLININIKSDGLSTADSYRHSFLSSP